MADPVLLTGATGFLGGHVLAALVARGRPVVVLKRRTSPTGLLDKFGSAIEVVDLETSPIHHILDDHGIATIVHLACDQGRGETDIVRLASANIVLGLELLAAARDCGVPRFLNADTQLEAGVNAYALSKKQFAAWLPYFADDLAIANLRLGNIYGPGEPPQGFLSWLFSEFAGNPASIAFTPGEQRRDFVHVSDVAAAFLAVLDTLPDAGLFPYDVGSGEFHSVREFVLAARDAYCDEVAEVTSALDFGGLAYRPGEVMQPQFDTSALRALGWKPAFDLAQGLRQTVRERTRDQAQAD